MNKRGLGFFIVGAVCIALAVGLVVYNLCSDISAGNESFEALMELSENTKPRNTIPAYMTDPNIPMPTKRIGDWDYIGVLELPSLKLVLPIIDRYSDAALQIAPARYSGSAYLDNMVIAAHNYSSHFGKLADLSLEDTIRFTDVDGNAFEYTVQELEVLQPTAVNEMICNDEGNWDLTLFTCTWGGQSRVAVRCARVQAHN